MASERFDRVEITEDVKKFVAGSFALSDRVKAAMLEKEVSLNTLAVRIGVSDQKLSMWLCGTHDWKLSQLVRIGHALTVDILF